MSIKPKPFSVNLPESNADDISSKMIYENIDINGTDLVKILDLSLSHAKQIASLHKKLNEFNQPSATSPNVNQEVFNEALLEGIYEPICLKWFVSRTLKILSERLELDVYESQQHLRPITKIIYNNNGVAESFLLDSTDAPKTSKEGA